MVIQSEPSSDMAEGFGYLALANTKAVRNTPSNVKDSGWMAEGSEVVVRLVKKKLMYKQIPQQLKLEVFSFQYLYMN
jgi:hypothetical protein